MKTITFDPNEWKLVPIEATQEMVDAWSSATQLPEGVAEQADDVVNAYAARRDWKAMLAASPETKDCYAATQPAAHPVEGVPDIARDTLQYIHDTFKRDLDAGYVTKDKRFAVDVAAEALAANMKL